MLEAKRRERQARYRFDTLAVSGRYDHAEALRNQGAICEPLYLASAEHFDSAEDMRLALTGEKDGWIYTRIGNPTITHLESVLASLEGYGQAQPVTSCVVSSGMTAVFMATQPFLHRHAGERPNMVVSAACYGGTFMLFNQRYAAEQGIDIRWVRDPLAVDEWAALVDANTRLLYLETPANPTLELPDIAALATLATAHEVPLIVDATLATPALLRPIGLGADIVVHSLSKGMGASGLCIGGVVSARHTIRSRWASPAVCDDFAAYLKKGPLRDLGCILSPFNAGLILCDLRSLRSRIDSMSSSALRVARFLADHPGVGPVYYPGLESSPSHGNARRDLVLVDSELDGPALNRYGHLLSFRVEGGVARCAQVFDRLQLIFRANDLGRVKSTATIPAIATHKQAHDADSAQAPVSAELIRLSVGLEHVEDILDDLQQALEPNP
ncbi:trans-sulfuration enzyme family protein [Pseudomonas sp. nanlin1]|uniref:trans-sulfuration enzyme family protein n=1 Tax=Pseudomonas sp. nanlin1 TaxID=3040605 RepID=UPI00388F180B